MTPREIEHALRSPDPEERRQATARLSDHAPEFAVDVLTQALGDEDWRVRKQAISVAVGMAPSTFVLRRLVELIGPHETNVGLRNAAVEALAGYGSACVDVLSMALPSLDADGKKLAAEALGATSHSAALVLLESLALDLDANVRAAAVEQIAVVGLTCVDRAAPALERHLDSPDALMRLTALNGLNDLGVATPWWRIEAMLDHPTLRNAALVAAARSGTQEAGPRMVRMLEGARGSVRRAVLTALAEHVRLCPDCAGPTRAALDRLPQAERDALLAGATTPNENIEERQRAVVLLGVLSTPGAAAAAVRALADERLSSHAEQALRLLGAEAIPALVSELASADVTHQAVRLELAGELANAASRASVAAAALEAIGGDCAGELAVAALDALAVVGDHGALPATARLLGHEDPMLRRSASDTLRTLARSYPAEAAALARRASPDGDDALAAAIVMATLDAPVRSGDEDVQFLSQALSNGSPHVRRAAVEALARVGSEHAVEAVAFALTDEEASVGSAALRALGRMRRPDGSAAGVEPLLALLRRGGPDETLAAAARALGDTRDGRALDVLRSLVDTAAPIVAVSAVEAIADLHHPERNDALLGALSHEDTEVVKAAMQRLADNPDVIVRSHITASLVHDAWDVRRLAADLLGRIGGEGTMARLRQSLAQEPEELVREAMQRALFELEARSSSIRRTTPPPVRGSSRHR